MALKLQFVFQDEPNKLDAIIADASLSESHSFGAEVTDFPVERGAAVSDNIRPQPVSLRLEAFISDFPLGSTGRVQSSSGGVQGTQRLEPQKSASQVALEKLRRLQTEGIVIAVDTGLQRYENMVLERLEVPRDKSVKNGIRVSMTLKEIRFASSATVEVAREAKGQRKKKGGDKAPEKPKAGESEVERRVAAAKANGYAVTR